MALDKNYMRLAQFYNNSASRNFIIQELSQDKAINYQIPANSSLGRMKLDFAGSTALHISLIVNDYKAFEKLIERGADFTIKNAKGDTVIHSAIGLTIRNSVTSLDAKDYFDNKFIRSVLSAHFKFKETLNPCNQNGISHFHVACMIGNVTVIKFFIKYGVSVSDAINSNSPIFPGFTPLHCAARYSSFRAVDVLFEHGASGHCKDVEGLTPFHLLIKRNMEIIDWVNMGKRAKSNELSYELKENDVVIEKMLKKYADVWFQKSEDAENKYMIGDTELSCLHVASTLQNTSLVEQLLEKNADLEQSISTDSLLWPGYTALHFAAHFNISTVKLLIKKGVNMLAQDVNGITPFSLCLQRYKAGDIAFHIDSQMDWKYTQFSDDTFLSVFIQAMENKSMLSGFLQDIMKNINVFIPADSLIWPGYTPLHVAVNFGGRYKAKINIYPCHSFFEINYNCNKEEEELYIERIKLMLEAGANVTAQDSYGSTPLHHAFMLQREDVVDLLLQYHKSTNINPIDSDNLSHLHIACAAGECNVVSKLLDKGFDPNLQTLYDYKYKKTYHKDAEPANFFFTAGSTPLHIAVIVREKEIVEMLLNNGAELYVKDYEGFTPVHRLLARDFHFQVVEIGKLLFAKNDLQDCETRFGLSHLHIASHVNNASVVVRLLDQGANINATVKYEKSSAASEPVDESLSFLSSYSDYTPLDFAVKDNCLGALNVLLNSDCEIIKSPLELICCNNIVSFFESLTQLEQKETLKNIFGPYKLHCACFKYDFEEVKKLLENKADPNLRIPESSTIFPGFTSLHILTCQRKYHSVEKIKPIANLLIRHGANSTLTNSDGLSPLHTVFDCKSSLFFYAKKISDSLLNGHMDFNVNPTNFDGISHFHAACICNKVTVVEEFLKKGVDVNQTVELFSQSYGGYTPLHFAAQFQSDETVDLLLKYGAKVYIQDCKGNTPLHYAVMTIESMDPNKNVAISLIRAGARMNVKNLAADIPFEKILNAKKVKVAIEILKILPKFQCFVNMFNEKNDCGYIALSICGEEKIKNIVENPLFAAVVKAPAGNGSDEMGRTPIHNIVAIRKLKASLKVYIKAIHMFVNVGIDINYQSKKGDTALHYAVKFQNAKAVIALLALGADINITNDSLNTPFSFSYHNTIAIEKMQYPMKVTNRILKEMRKHVCKLQVANLFVSNVNKKYQARAHHRSGFDSDAIQQCVLEIVRFETRKIDSTNVTFSSLLLETGAIASYPHMIMRDRLAIDNLFQNRNFRLREEFPEFSGILQMQYQKAVQRQVDLLEPAKSSLENLTDFVLPDLCCYCVLKFLTNDDLKKLIAVEEDIVTPPKKRRKLE